MAETLGQVKDEQRAREMVADETVRWLAGLPENVRPTALPQQFPRMANALARRWRSADACRTYLEDLLIDKRGSRRGLPPAIADELARLKNYFETELYPMPQTVWDEVANRRRNR